MIKKRFFKKTIWQILLYFFAVIGLLFTILIVMLIYDGSNYELSNRVTYGRRYGWQNPSLYNPTDGTYYIRNIDRYYLPADKDSVLVYFKGAKRGLFNFYTGEIIADPIYDAAWIYKRGVAAVCQGDSVFFVNNRGKQVGDIKFLRENGRIYVFHHPFMVIRYNGKTGLVNPKGEWLIPPDFKYIEQDGEYWSALTDDRLVIFNDEFEEIYRLDNLTQNVDSIIDPSSDNFVTNNIFYQISKVYRKYYEEY